MSAETATSTGTPLLSAAAADKVGVTNLERPSAKGAEGWATPGLEGKGLATHLDRKTTTFPVGQALGYTLASLVFPMPNCVTTELGHLDVVLPDGVIQDTHAAVHRT